jgi:hypothetical protein
MSLSSEMSLFMGFLMSFRGMRLYYWLILLILYIDFVAVDKWL